MIVRSAVCDPADPYLDHHRPGGAPLLGTVMQLSVMAEALALDLAGAMPDVVRDVVIGPPLVFTGGAAQTVRITATPAGNAAWDVELSSGSDHARVRHTAARFAFGAVEPDASLAGCGAPARWSVGAADIYACYFHGPAFRVLAGATRIDDRICARAVTALPPLARDLRPFAIAPRLIEFALQTAGLVHLAFDRTMMIPLRIACITRVCMADIGDGGTYLAFASRHSADPAPPSSPGAVIDIVVTDATGAIVLEVAGYACAPLPYAHSHAAGHALAAALNATPMTQQETMP